MSVCYAYLRLCILGSCMMVLGVRPKAWASGWGEGMGGVLLSCCDCVFSAPTLSRPSPWAPGSTWQGDRQCESRPYYVYPWGLSVCWIETEWEKKKFRKRGKGNKTGKNRPELHPEAQRSGKVGLICHNRSRSKWKDEPNIWPTALSFIAHSLSLRASHSEDLVAIAFDPWLLILKFQPSKHCQGKGSDEQQNPKLQKMFPIVAY